MSKSQIILAGTRNELQTINASFQQKCGSSYKLELSQYKYRDLESAVYDETSNNYDIILCLYHRQKCVSSVTGKYNTSDNSMELLSKTAPEYEGLKFNLYLRTIFIYLMCFVRPSIKTIYSHSLNPISTYAMYKHYNAFNPDLQEYTRERGLTPSTFTLADATQFHTYFTEKYRTPEHAKEELEQMLEEYSMEELGLETEEDAIAFIMTTMPVRAITLKLNLEMPGIKEFLFNKLSSLDIKCENRTGGKSRSKSKSKSKRRRFATRSKNKKNKKMY